MNFKEWQKTRKYYDNLETEVPSFVEPNTKGYTYEVGFLYLDHEFYYCDVYNEGIQSTSLEEVEKFLWENYAKGELK